MIVGDSAYPLQPWLIKRYPGNLQGAKREFNRQLSSLRVIVECAFGRLQARFRCLLKRLDVDYKFATEIVGACCTLHNIVERRGEPFPHNGCNKLTSKICFHNLTKKNLLAKKTLLACGTPYTQIFWPTF